MSNRQFVKRPRLVAVPFGLAACFFLLGGFGRSHAAAAVEIPLAETNLIPANISLYTESMLWDKQITLSSGLGYKDNVLLSQFDRRGSAFFANGLDCALTRLPLDGWEVESSLVGEDLRYWRDAGTRSEDSFIGTIGLKRDLPGGWRAGLDFHGLYEKEVLDISPAPTLTATALVEGEGLTASPSVRRDLGSQWWVQVEMPVTRWWLAAPLDDDWEFGPVVSLGRPFGRQTQLTASYGASLQDHNSWTAYADPRGYEPLPQKLQLFRQQMALAWRQYWDHHQRWRSSTQLIFARLQDNGGGYYNEDEYQAIEELRWQTPDWLVKGSVDFTREDYPVQWVGSSATSATLNRNLLDVSAEVERRLYKGLKTYAKAAWQQAVSNEVSEAFDYHAATISAGLRYEF